MEGEIHEFPIAQHLTQEERRNIFEKKSHHIAEGVKYLPSVARQLYHSRDIGEPFDFLTWFEYAPQYSEAFEELVRTLRKLTATTQPITNTELTEPVSSAVSSKIGTGVRVFRSTRMCVTGGVGISHPSKKQDDPAGIFSWLYCK